MILIKKCIPEDLEALQQLSVQTFQESFASHNTEENMNHYINTDLHPDQLERELANWWSRFYFIYTDHKLAGYMKLNFEAAQTELKDPESIEIQRIYILQEFQNEGLGQLLLEKVFDMAKQEKKSYIWLGVWDQNKAAIRFYERYGFYQFGAHNFFLGNEEQTDLLMKKTLS